jgi:hypothetical protein
MMALTCHEAQLGAFSFVNKNGAAAAISVGLVGCSYHNFLNKRFIYKR